jgi:hypothetical protein
MAHLEMLTADDFAPHAGSPFLLAVPDSTPVTLVLREAAQLESQATARRNGFFLHFAGPKIPALPQKIYSLDHEVMGGMEIFLVPIGETAEERQYEAIFN